MKKAFTLIELLVVISIIGILIALSVFGLQGARAGARDARRKTDLEEIRSGIEIYKADCGVYPPGLSGGQPLIGSLASCSPQGSTYITLVPQDPTPTQKGYAYTRPTTTTYILCSALEQGTAGDVTGCGSCNGSGGSASCTYKVTNP